MAINIDLNEEEMKEFSEFLVELSGNSKRNQFDQINQNTILIEPWINQILKYTKDTELDSFTIEKIRNESLEESKKMIREMDSEEQTKLITLLDSSPNNLIDDFAFYLNKEKTLSSIKKSQEASILIESLFLFLANKHILLKIKD